MTLAAPYSNSKIETTFYLPVEEKGIQLTFWNSIFGEVDQ